MTKQEIKIEAFGNSSIIFDADTMPYICWESGTGYFFENATPERLENFKKANGLPDEFDQADIESWVENNVK